MKISEIIISEATAAPSPAGTFKGSSSDAPYGPLGNANDPDKRELVNRKTMKDSDMSPFTQTRVKSDWVDTEEESEEEDNEDS